MRKLIQKGKSRKEISKKLGDEIELEKKQMEAHIKREIDAIELQLGYISDNEYELLGQQLELDKKNLEDQLNLDLMRMDLEILRMGIE